MAANVRWILLGGVVTTACSLALQRPIDPEAVRRLPLPVEFPVSASIYFDAAQVTLNDDNLRSLSAIAKAASDRPMPIAIVTFAKQPEGPSLRLTRARAARVREALVTAGVPSMRIVVLSPTFAENEAPRIEVSLVRGVRVFRPQPDVTARVDAEVH